ncbi:MAG: hypothetical protein V4475_11855 [Pseudomonadota bacterium]
MQWIYDKIAKYAGVVDPVELNEIYGIMADNVRAFGSLSPEQFRREVREAMAVNDYLKTDLGKAYVEQLEREMLATA